MNRDRVSGLRRSGLLLAVATVTVGPSVAAAQAPPMSPEAASAALSQMASLFLTRHAGYGRSGAFTTAGGRWMQDPEKGLTYVCTVEAAVIPTTPGAVEGMAFRKEVTVFVNPDTGTVQIGDTDPQTGGVRVGGGDISGWSRWPETVASLRRRFPEDEPEETEAPPEEEPTPPGDTPGSPTTVPPADDGETIGGLLEILAGEIGRVAGEAVPVADPPAVAPPPTPPPSGGPPAAGPPPSTGPEAPPPAGPGTDGAEAPPGSDPPSGNRPPRSEMERILEDHDPGRPAEEETPCDDPGDIRCSQWAEVHGDPPGEPRVLTPEDVEREEREAAEQFEAFRQMMGQ